MGTASSPMAWSQTSRMTTSTVMCPAVVQVAITHIDLRLPQIRYGGNGANKTVFMNHSFSNVGELGYGIDTSALPTPNPTGSPSCAPSPERQRSRR